MKHLSLLIVVLMFSFLQAQEEENPSFRYNPNGLSPREVTVEVTGMTKETMHSKAKEWLEEKFKDPDEVTDKDDDEDDKGSPEDKKKTKKLRFKGATSNVICFTEDDSYTCEDVNYTIQLKFFDGKYTFKPVKLSYKRPGKKKTSIKFNQSSFHTSGQLKKGYKKVASQIEDLFNKMNRSLNNYLTGKAQEDEW
ncbi:DUF4468 domain-containing protein [Seonamhaeicola sp.]|uniref:DUF4468 domain-containing protein n=1 Tax=Seonamhaeicola sp. TaxID=1912245 RepID=UPI00260EA8D4|nr:DUF4468 domain-containing protein [Seonamhaeicola sp.]